MARIRGVLIVIVGLGLVWLVVGNRLFSVAPAFDRLTGGFRPVMTAEALEPARQDVAALGAVAEEFGTKVVPTLSAALMMSPEELQAFVGSNFPAVAAGTQALPDIVSTFDGLLTLMDGERERFASADSIPTTTLPTTTVPWIILVSGIAAVIIGLVALRPGRAGPVLAVVLGLVLVVAPFALSLPSKAADADQLNANLAPVYTAETIAGAEQALAIVGAMAQEMQATMLPALAEQLQLPPDQLQPFLAENFPALAAAMEGLPAAMGRFQGLVTVFETHLGDYQTASPVAFAPIVQRMLAAGAIILVLGLLGLGSRRRATS